MCEEKESREKIIKKSFKWITIKNLLCMLIISMLLVCDLPTSILIKADEQKNEYIITFKKNENIYTMRAYDKKAENRC